MNDMNQEFLSLADLATQDVSDVAALTSRIPAEGIYDVLGKSALAVAGTPKDGKPPLHRFVVKAEILAAELVDVNIDPEGLIGRDLTYSHTIWPDDVTDCIGMLKGNVAKIGLPTKGPIGGIEGAEPGFLDQVVGYQFQIRVRHGKRKDGEAIAYLDWLPAPERD